MAEPRVNVLDVRRLRMHFPIHAGFFKRVVGHVKAVDDVSFAVRAGETLALVGESGCGKTTTARCILRGYRPTAGRILFRTDDGATVDLTTLQADGLRRLRPQMQMIFQDPFSSLNPRMTLFEIVSEPMVVHRRAVGPAAASRAGRQERVAELLHLVGLRPEFMERYPHAFSGGQRQRIGIARALALQPSLVVADEPVSALDVSVQAQILNLLLDLQETMSLTYVFVAHDLSVVRHISDRVAVMYVGRLVEVAANRTLFSMPGHPYTEALLGSAPKPDPRQRARRATLAGEVADPADPPPGCSFHPRCPYAVQRCRTETPPLREVAPGQLVSCHLAEDLGLTGVAPGSGRMEDH